MWQIKQIDPKTKRAKIIKTNLVTKEIADGYLNNQFKDLSDIWIEEKDSKTGSVVDLTNMKGEWLWIFSPKKQEFFPYGILADVSSQFVRVQTKEDSTDIGDFRLSKIKSMLDNNTLRFEKEGHFVVLKDYL